MPLQNFGPKSKIFEIFNFYPRQFAWKNHPTLLSLVFKVEEKRVTSSLKMFSLATKATFSSIELKHRWKAIFSTMFKDPTFQAYPWIFYNISFEDDVTIILILGVSLMVICISSGYNRAMCLNVVLFSEKPVQNYLRLFF